MEVTPTKPLISLGSRTSLKLLFIPRSSSSTHQLFKPLYIPSHSAYYSSTTHQLIQPLTIPSSHHVISHGPGLFQDSCFSSLQLHLPFTKPPNTLSPLITPFHLLYQKITFLNKCAWFIYCWLWMETF